MVVAAAMSTAFLGATSLAQIGEPFGKDSMTKKPFDSAAIPEDGNEMVDIAWEYLPKIPGRDSSGLAFTFEIDPGWHLYWKNNGDTGMPIMLKLLLPEGVTAGEILWPTPKRYEHSGGLLDYIYEDKVTLIVPVPSGWSRGPIKPRASIEFLVCQEACIPGERSLDLFPVKRPSSDWRERADALMARLPIPPGDAAEWRWDGTTLVLEAKEAESMTFFPEAGENIRPVNPLRDGVAQGDTLRFAYRDAVRKADVVRGVLEVRNRDGSAAFYQVQAPAPK
jgi:thiol:disulfide interchange protein DsbD